MEQKLIKREQLEAMGIDLDEQAMESLLKEVNEELDGRVGAAVMAELDDEQMEEYGKIEDSLSDGDAVKWLEERIPDLSQIVQDEVDIILGDLAEKADTLVN